MLESLINNWNLSKDQEGIYRGHRQDLSRIAINPVLVRVLKNKGFERVEEFSTGHREIYKNDDLKAIFTYCEGDLSLKTADTQEDYQTMFNDMVKFYQKYM
ncbi:MAG TPA: hypothetical protein VJ962_05890 [Clostridia bacterium]|nr:hypothetical protein [Clostridia bacterium]